MKTTKKMNKKDLLKTGLKSELIAYFEAQGVQVIDAAGYEGFTKDTLIVERDGLHVQIKLITPSQKVGNKYELE